MKRDALYFTGEGQVVVREEDFEPPASGQILVRTIASAISAGTELLVYRGLVPAGLAVDETIAALSGDFSFPLKYGYSAVGEVVALGPNVHPVWEGRRVFAFHPHESHFVSMASQLIPLPSKMATDDALFLPNMETAVSMVMDGRPMLGERVAVFGQGVVGLLTTALLARMPLVALVTLDCYPMRRKTSLSFGAHASLDPKAAEVHARLKSLLQVRGDQPYSGADLSFELSGFPAALAQAIAATGFGGRVVIGSWYGSKDVCLEVGGHLHRSRICLISSQVSSIAPELTGRWSKERRLELASRMVQELNPSQLITHRLAFDRAAEAYELLDQRPEEAIQVILTY